MKKIEQRPWSDLNLMEKLERISIPLRERIVFSAMVALPKRFWTEVLMLISPGRPMPLRYRTLYPRWDLIEQYGQVSDDDAVADIDPHACIAFFKTRGYLVMSHPMLFIRLTARHEPVIMRKPGLSGRGRE